MRLPRGLRITEGYDFRAVRELGQSKAGRYLVLGVLRDPSAAHFRYGFITSKRVGNAVTRNLVRRRLKAIVRETGDELQGGGMLVTIARHTAARASYAELSEDWRRIAQRLVLLPRTTGEGGR